MTSFARTATLTGVLAASTLAIEFARADEPIEPPPMTSPVPPPASPSAPVHPQHETAQSEADGVVQLVDEALSGIELRADQTDALQEVGRQVDDAVSSVEGAKRAFLIALAQQIESGTVDASALQAQISRIEDEAEKARPVLRRGLERVHDVLDPQQRKDFVANFRQALKKREASLDTSSKVDALASSLDLSPEQKRRITLILDNDAWVNSVMRDRVDEILDAFSKDSFSIDEVAPKGSARDDARQMLERLIDTAKKITDVLTPEQRAKAARAIHGAASESPSPNEPEDVGKVSQPLWAGRGYLAGSSYRRSVSFPRTSGYAFSGGYATGFGDFYLLTRPGSVTS